jgi:hypothetical protein
MGRADHLPKIPPGVSGNPRGGSRKASEKKLMKQLINKAEMEEIGKLVLQGKLSKLEEILEDSKKDGKKKHSVMKVMFAAQALAAMKGKTEAFNAVLDRLIGKVPAPVQLSSPDGSMRPQLILTLPDNGKRAKPDAAGNS